MEVNLGESSVAALLLFPYALMGWLIGRSVVSQVEGALSVKESKRVRPLTLIPIACAIIGVISTMIWGFIPWVFIPVLLAETISTMSILMLYFVLRDDEDEDEGGGGGEGPDPTDPEVPWDKWEEISHKWNIPSRPLTCK